jgi:hypothetical protein
MFKNIFVPEGMGTVELRSGIVVPPLDQEYLTFPFISASIIKVAPIFITCPPIK